MADKKGISGLKITFSILIIFVLIAIIVLFSILFLSDKSSDYINISGDDYSLYDDPNYGRCVHTWSDDSGEIVLGYNEAEEAKVYCRNELNQSKCETIDIYSKATNMFRSKDGIPDCVWN